jgi:hypothetical protein
MQNDMRVKKAVEPHNDGLATIFTADTGGYRSQHRAAAVCGARRQLLFDVTCLVEKYF